MYAGKMRAVIRGGAPSFIIVSSRLPPPIVEFEDSAEWSGSDIDTHSKLPTPSPAAKHALNHPPFQVYDCHERHVLTSRPSPTLTNLHRLSLCMLPTIQQLLRIVELTRLRAITNTNQTLSLLHDTPRTMTLHINPSSVHLRAKSVKCFAWYVPSSASPENKI